MAASDDAAIGASTGGFALAILILGILYRVCGCCKTKACTCTSEEGDCGLIFRDKDKASPLEMVRIEHADQRKHWEEEAKRLGEENNRLRKELRAGRKELDHVQRNSRALVDSAVLDELATLRRQVTFLVLSAGDSDIKPPPDLLPQHAMLPHEPMTPDRISFIMKKRGSALTSSVSTLATLRHHRAVMAPEKGHTSDDERDDSDDQTTIVMTSTATLPPFPAARVPPN